MDKIFDLIVVGSGPVGLASAIEAKKLGLSCLVLDKGVLANSLFHFPIFMRFFTESKLLEIGGFPFPSTNIKPTRQQALDYYRRVVEISEIKVLQHHLVENISKKELFEVGGVKTRKNIAQPFLFSSRFVIVATGYFDNPVGLGGIPGETGENTSYYYSEPHQFYDKDVVVIGAGNSGAEVALELYRHGARVTLVHNHSEPRSTLKYWVGPDLKNRIKNDEINAVMPARTKEITSAGVLLEYQGSDIHIPADFVFILTGFTPDTKMLTRWGIILDKESFACNLSDNYESNINGLFLVGSVGFGNATNTVFIENGREHAVTAVVEIKSRLG